MSVSTTRQYGETIPQQALREQMLRGHKPDARQQFELTPRKSQSRVSSRVPAKDTRRQLTLGKTYETTDGVRIKLLRRVSGGRYLIGVPGSPYPTDRVGAPALRRAIAKVVR